MVLLVQNSEPADSIVLPKQIMTKQFDGQKCRYKVFQDVGLLETITMVLFSGFPYYYLLIKCLEQEPVDVYSYQNGKWVPINLFGNYVSGYNLRNNLSSLKCLSKWADD